MALDPHIAAMIPAAPPSLGAKALDLTAYRREVNQASAAAPRYDVPLASVEDRAIEFNGHAIGVRIYTPACEGPFPIIVYYHGGGFVIGDLNVSDPICRALCAGIAALIVSVDYRLAPEHPFPAANEDGWNALQWVAENATEIGGDASRIAVAGDSAGANLSAAMTLRARDAGFRLVAQGLMYPAPAYPDLSLPSFRDHAAGPLISADGAVFCWDQFLTDPAQRTDPDAAPAHAATLAGLPPAFISTAECDPTRDTGEAYAEQLKAAGVPTLARRYAGMPHGFYAWVPYVPTVKSAMAEFCEWFKGQFAAVPTTSNVERI